MEREKLIGKFELRYLLAKVIFNNNGFQEQVLRAYSLINTAIKANKKILIFGNGGSAAEAQHFAGELVCQFAKQRRALAALALTTDTSVLTAVGNDLGFGLVFARQIEALADHGDVVIGLTTSDSKSDGHSVNVQKAFEAAVAKGAGTIGLFSLKTEYLVKLVDVAVIVPSLETDLIQEIHLEIIHVLSGLVEDDL